jgi:hypothetical protein
MSQLSTFIGIMAFYAVLSCFLFPAAFYYFMGKSIASAGTGYVVGSIVSVALWFFFGSKMI